MATFDQRARAELVEAVTKRVAARRSSAFATLGEAACRKHVEAAVGALEADLEADVREAVRGAVRALIDELMPAGLGFADLRFFARTLREQVDERAPEERSRALDAWFYEHLSVCTMHFVVKRDEQLVEQAARRSVERYESQLAELRVALEEKTELLETIRQASTPIAPVFRGILVVPLVGVFDGFRAQVLTEKLLDEVARVQARAAILDISGVPVFDTDAAQLIIRLSRSVRLLGAEVILVGMSADNARTIVELGIELADLTTLGTLQDGLAKALSSRGLRIAPV